VEVFSKKSGEIFLKQCFESSGIFDRKGSNFASEGTMSSVEILSPSFIIIVHFKEFSSESFKGKGLILGPILNL